jgi:hypothetical protein
LADAVPWLLSCSELVEYKYVVLNADGTVDRWQPGDNLKMEVPIAQVGFSLGSVLMGLFPASHSLVPTCLVVCNPSLKEDGFT